MCNCFIPNRWFQLAAVAAMTLSAPRLRPYVGHHLRRKCRPLLGVPKWDADVNGLSGRYTPTDTKCLELSHCQTDFSAPRGESGLPTVPFEQRKGRYIARWAEQDSAPLALTWTCEFYARSAFIRTLTWTGDASMRR
jgi:hypothetical protein